MNTENIATARQFVNVSARRVRLYEVAEQRAWNTLELQENDENLALWRLSDKRKRDANESFNRALLEFFVTMCPFDLSDEEPPSLVASFKSELEAR